MDDELLAANETDWVRRAREGDGEAFEALFNAYYAMTFSLAYTMCGSHHDAEEIAQEAFIKAARAFPRFRGDSRVKTWLYRIAMNTATDFLRRRRSEVELEPNMAVAGREAKHPMAEALWAALEKLSQPQRKAIVLTYFEGMNHAEAAEVLECAETTVSWRVFTAKRKLKKILSGHGMGRDGL